MATTFPLRAMADLGRVLEAPDADFGHWVTPPPKDGVLSLGWYELGPAGEAFRAAAEGWIEAGFDWRSWLESGEGSALRTPAAVAGATQEQLAKLLTAIIRSDRFVEGSMEGAFESGLLAAICRRAGMLLESGA